MRQKKVEIMAPAGSFASLSAAINAGCDSVYFGVEQLNMRARASYNFKLEELQKVSNIAKKAGIKTYIALNTLMYEHDMNLMKQIIDKAKEVGLSAVIVADMAAMQYATNISMPIQASTQLSISNSEAVKFYSRYADTMVLAREVDLTMMKKICDKILEEDIRGPSGELVKIEVFVHGALCIAQSGRCQMSILQTNTSAQRGACLQECRKKYRIFDDETGKEMMLENSYVLSPKDLCTIDFLDRILDAGVSILKIEGRGRSPQYVDLVVRSYKEARDAIYEGSFSKDKIENWMNNLKKVFNRGFCDGYYLGKPLPEWSGTYGSQATEENVFVGLITHYFAKSGVAEINVQANPLSVGDRISVVGNTTGVIYSEIKEIRHEEKSVNSVNNPALITIPLTEKVRRNDQVYLIKERKLNEEVQSCS